MNLDFDPVRCTLCPRQCGGDRTKGRGRCRMPEAPVLARAALHQWEEPPLSGTRGAGTVFFSGCSLGCVFCQNDSISQKDFGKEVSLSRLREIFFELIDHFVLCKRHELNDKSARTFYCVVFFHQDTKTNR